MIDLIKYFPSLFGLNIRLSRVVGNVHNYHELMNYLEKHKPNEVLLDCGVHKIFHLMKLKDYPKYYVDEYYLKCKIIAKTFKEIDFYVVVPDVPTDYPDNPIVDNIAKTIRWIEDYLKHRYLDSCDNVTMIATVQGRKDSVSSIVNAYHRYKNLYNQFEIIALGPTCTTRNVNKLARIITCFDKITERKYHVFGPNVKVIKLIVDKVKMMYSFDSSSFYRNEAKMCKTRHERQQFLLKFLEKLKQIGVDVPEVST